MVSVPAAHPYPQRVSGSEGITVLPDPVPAGVPAGQWWPPVALDPSWIRDNASAADLVHIHFGTESFTPEHLAACVAAAHDVGWPVVFTVHDLEHPQLSDSDQSGYREQLDVLIPAADALITLTAGAAREIQRRWGRSALVLPHPAVVSDASAMPQPPASASYRVEMHLKDLRSNIDSVAMVTALCGAIDDLARAGREVTALVRMHHRVRDAAARAEIRAITAGSERVELLEHDRLDDSALAHAIAGSDVCVLPYRHGTHSGWLELCWDLGTGIAAPALGFYAEQHADGSVASFSAERSVAPSAEPDGMSDGMSLAAAIAAALDSPRATRPGSDDRAAEVRRRQAQRETERDSLTSAHAALYRQLVLDRTPSELRS
ncbi:glycosyl transferase family 4 [Glaciihabitans tibetensis]|uniref:Glycosyl transferase family 4 n=1 Tax=Glaciihabitans tibetensis TaxID=1266600 RepID=A0A2T0VC01_9MICO|nr:glycosyltransferase family 4 protein [Glaciihabitans tibetensis]PRY67682.1 glycosyl transferase family 4 [Glaciihabitans tibetensis]